MPMYRPGSLLILAHVSEFELFFCLPVVAQMQRTDHASQLVNLALTNPVSHYSIDGVASSGFAGQFEYFFPHRRVYVHSCAHQNTFAMMILRRIISPPSQASPRTAGRCTCCPAAPAKPPSDTGSSAAGLSGLAGPRPCRR